MPGLPQLAPPGSVAENAGPWENRGLRATTGFQHPSVIPAGPPYPPPATARILPSPQNDACDAGTPPGQASLAFLSGWTRSPPGTPAPLPPCPHLSRRSALLPNAPSADSEP